MNDDADVRERALRLRDENLAKLVSLARDRKAAEDCVGWIKFAWGRFADDLLSVRSQGNSNRYGEHKSASLAILDLLDETGHALSPDVIIEALTKGGFRGGMPKTVRTKVLQSISAKRTKKIKEVNGLIGRTEWPRDRFTS